MAAYSPFAATSCVVRAALGDAAVVQHEDLIRVAHGRDAVRHDDRRPLAHDAAQPGQDLLLGVGVHRRERVVQDQDRRIDHHRARERRALLLPARQRDAALPHRRLEAAREVRDVLVQPRHRRRRRDSRSGVRPGCPWLRPRLVGVPRPRRRRCRRWCRRRGTAPAARSRWRRAGGRAGSRGCRRRRSVTVPGGGSCSRGSRLIRVDLPEPVPPTNATVWPGSMRRLTSFRTGAVGVRDR